MAIPLGLPERLIKIREKNGYTRKRLAEELGRPYRTLTNYELGEREPGHTYIIEIAKKFGVTTDYILGLSDDPHKTSDGKRFSDTSEAASGEEPTQMMLAPDEQQLVTDYRSLNPQGQALVRQNIEVVVLSDKYKKSHDLSDMDKEA